MAGKSSKNPLLSGAGISFPFENFTNSTLLVPVPQNEATLIPEEIEADSFVNQEPLRSGSTSSFKVLPSLTAPISKSYSSQSLSGPVSHPEPTLSSHHFPSEPQLHHSPVPEFTKNFKGEPTTAKPTSVYADSLQQQFYPPRKSPASETLLQSTSFSQVAKSASIPVQPPPSSLLFSNQIPSNFSTPTVLNPAPTVFNPVPSVLTPAPTTVTPNSSSVQTTNLNNLIPHNFPPVGTTSTSASSSSLSNSLSNPDTFTPVPLTSASNTSPSSCIQPILPTLPEFSTTIFTPLPTPATTNSSVHNLNNNFPSILTPVTVEQSVTQSFTPEVLSAPPSQSFFSYFSTQKQPQQNSNTSSFPLSNPPLFSPPLSNPPLSSPPLSNPPLSSLPLAKSSLSSSQLSNSPPTVPPQTLLETSHPPPSGGHHNSYRLSNIKRPTYTRPPELPVAPMATMPAPLAPAPLSQPQPATLFTPSSALAPCVDNTDSPAVIDAPATPAVPSAPAPQTTPYRFPSQGQTSPPAQASVLPPSFASLAQGNTYRPVYHHWFYKKIVEGKVLWNPFSMHDSLALEESFTSATISPETRVATEGARYDVEVLRRRRHAVYWEEESSEVRRCSWFVKGSMDVRYVPYEENVSTMLEEEYRIASTTNEWNRQISLPDGETIILHSPHAISHHTRSTSPDAWGNSPQMQVKPRVVKRGMDEFDISEGEPEKVDHLLFLVHGIGKFCDLKFRPVIEVVDDFRSVTLQLVQSHFKEAVEGGQVGRVEVLPVSWHQALHSAHIDQRLNNITLQSIPRLRHFTNDTLLDILFYTSPVFCETIVQAVGNEMNRLYNVFLSRNPSFEGGVSLGGHSLGSLILFDMLCNQVPEVKSTEREAQSVPASPTGETQEPSGDEEVKTLGCIKGPKAQLSRSVSYLKIGTAGTGQPFIHYPQLAFKPKAFFALGSPIGMFVTVRGIESLGEDFALPTCPLFFNIFHPFDPVAYRIESLINSDFSKYTPVLIPHHKGRKRMHLELKDTLEHVGAALKQRLTESFKSTWNSVYQTVFFGRATDHSAIEQEVNKVIEKELLQSCAEDSEKSQALASDPGPDVKMGLLNRGRRVDYVLQEAPLESFNEYLFALSSHVCYWESEDTMLMMLKEMYATMGVSPDSQVVQQILPYEAPDSSSLHPQYVALQAAPQAVGMDPTAPVSDNVNVGPPPVAGFFR